MSAAETTLGIARHSVDRTGQDRTGHDRTIEKKISTSQQALQYR